MQPPQMIRRGTSVVLLVSAMLIVLASAGITTTGAAPGAQASLPAVFRNPLRTTDTEANGYGGGGDAPDPYMQYWNGNYYLTYTRQTYIEIKKAATVGELTDVTPTIVWSPQAMNEPPERSQQLWAPEFHRIDGPNGPRWYIYYAASDGNIPNHRMHVLESAGDDPLGPYSYKAQLTPNTEFAIDATVYQHTDGKLYLVYNSSDPPLITNLYLAAMSNPWTLGSSRLLISRPTYEWELRGPVNEAPQVLVYGDKLHVVYSASQCTTDFYALGRLTVPLNSNLLDPNTWATAKYPQPIFQSSALNSVYSPGHNGFFKSPDGKEDWIVYHAHVKPAGPVTGGGCLGNRTTRIQKFTWNADGTPNLGEPVSLDTDLIPPSGDPTLTRQFENLAVQASSGDLNMLVLDNSALVGNRGMELQADAADDYVTYTVNVPQAGTYDLGVRVKRATDRGMFQLSIADADGSGTQPYGQPQDLYAPQTAYNEAHIGNVIFAQAGDYRFTFTLTGKNAASTGYGLLLDQLRLTPATPAAPSATQAPTSTPFSIPPITPSPTPLTPTPAATRGPIGTPVREGFTLYLPLLTR